MSVEDGDNSPPQETLSAHAKELIDSGFSEGRKLYGDHYNGVGILQRWMETPEGIQAIKPLKHYRQYMEEKGRKKPAIDYVMALSDPGAIVAFDQLIDEFNADLERIKQDNDKVAIQLFLDRITALIYKKG